MKTLLSTTLLFVNTIAFCQVGVGTITPDTNAELEISSTTKGLLLPRVALVMTTDPSPLSAHVKGMLVYNTATTGDVSIGPYVNDGTKWGLMGVGEQSLAAFCTGFQGNWAVGNYTRTYKVTIANNSLFSASITPMTTDLMLNPASGLTVASVSPNTSTSVPAGGALEVTYTMGGTLSATTGTVITGTFAKNGLSCNNTVTVGNNTPIAGAGSDQNVVQPASTASLTGSASDTDGTVASVLWTQTAGPATAVIASANTVTTGISGLTTLGTYTFRLTVTDDIGATGYDEVNVYVVTTFTGAGSTFSTAPTGVYSGQTAAFSTNSSCTAKTISVTPCAAVSGATLNDDAATTMGTEYDWDQGTTYVAGNLANTDNNTRALVEINNQCWYRRNANSPSSFSGAGTATNVAYYGRLYTQYQATGGNPAIERGQGVCPAGWHVPSDCEYQYLEHSLGMSVEEQQLESNNRSIPVGQKLSNLVPSGNNLSGFTALMAGYGSGGSGSSCVFWTSTINYRRMLSTANAYVSKSAQSGGQTTSVRCLKD